MIARNQRPRCRYGGLELLIEKGEACRFIIPFCVNRGDRFVILCRVSSGEQGKRGNLAGQEKSLRQEVESRAGIVLDVIRVEWSGRGEEWLWEKFFRIARTIPEGAALLAACTDRFIRARTYRSDHPVLCQRQATYFDLRELSQAALGVPLMTFLDPDAPPDDCRSLLIKWGQSAKGNKGGRPRKKHYAKHRKAPKVLARRAYRRGRSLSWIAKHLAGFGNITKSHVQYWVRGVEKGAWSKTV